MREESIKILKVVALFLVALSATLASYQYKLSVDNTYPTRTFSVDGVGDIETVPDLATFSATVVSEGGKNVTEVQTANSEKMNRIDVFLKEQGIEKKDLKTTQYLLAPRYSYSPCLSGGCPAPTISGYSLTQTLEVKVRDNEKLGGLLSGVVENGANSVSEIRFVVDDDEAVKDTARKEAINDAKKKAKATAQAAGFRLGKLVTLYEGFSPMPYDARGDNMESSLMKGGLGGAAPTVEPGTQSTKIQVTLVYEIYN